MCRESGEIVLIDFGLAVRITDISNPLSGVMAKSRADMKATSKAVNAITEKLKAEAERINAEAEAWK